MAPRKPKKRKYTRRKTKKQPEVEKKWYQEIPKKILNFLFIRKADTENVWQYILRNLEVADSNGKPSWTLTILLFVMVICGAVVFFEIKIAQSDVTIKAPDGTITTQLRGFSDTFIWFISLLAGVITYFFQAREKRLNGNGNGGIISQTLGKVRDKISEIAKR